VKKIYYQSRRTRYSTVINSITRNQLLSVCYGKFLLSPSVSNVQVASAPRANCATEGAALLYFHQRLLLQHRMTDFTSKFQTNLVSFFLPSRGNDRLCYMIMQCICCICNFCLCNVLFERTLSV